MKNIETPRKKHAGKGIDGGGFEKKNDGTKRMVVVVVVEEERKIVRDENICRRC